MRAVLDTNVLARVAMSPSGLAAEVFDRLRSDHLLVVSADILDELFRVLSYDRVHRVHQLDDLQISQFVEHIETGSLVVALPDPLPPVVPDDPADDAVVATAVAGNADVICTRNKHLAHPNVIAYCRQRSIEVMDDIELIRRLRQISGSGTP